MAKSKLSETCFTQHVLQIELVVLCLIDQQRISVELLVVALPDPPDWIRVLFVLDNNVVFTFCNILPLIDFHLIKWLHLKIRSTLIKYQCWVFTSILDLASKSRATSIKFSPFVCLTYVLRASRNHDIVKNFYHLWLSILVNMIWDLFTIYLIFFCYFCLGTCNLDILYECFCFVFNLQI